MTIPWQAQARSSGSTRLPPFVNLQNAFYFACKSIFPRCSNSRPIVATLICSVPAAEQLPFLRASWFGADFVSKRFFACCGAYGRGSYSADAKQTTNKDK